MKKCSYFATALDIGIWERLRQLNNSYFSHDGIMEVFLIQISQKLKFEAYQKR